MSITRLRDIAAPGEDTARGRAREVARAALARREPRRRGISRLVLTGAAALAAAVLVVTPAGGEVADWVAEVVSPAQPPVVEVAGARLPGGGRQLLVGSGGPLVVFPDGHRRRLLGRVDEATWSPRGLFVAATRGPELIAVDMQGKRRWSIAPGPGLREPRWSPSGYRVAYISGAPGQGGRVIRIVNGDGTGDRVLAATRPVAPAWRPRHPEQLATVDSAGRVALRDADSGRVLWRRRSGSHVTQLAWTPDGRTLLALAPRSLTHDGDGVLTESFARGAAERHVAAAFSGTRRFALVVQTKRGSRVQLTTPRGTRTLLTLRAHISDVAWSPDGRWLALARGTTTLLLDIRSRDLRTVEGGRFQGWCCRR